MTINDPKKKIIYIGIEHLNPGPAMALMRGEVSVYQIGKTEVERHKRVYFEKHHVKQNYSLVLFANNRHKVLIYNAK